MFDQFYAFNVEVKEKSTCNEMELVLLALLIYKAKWAFLQPAGTLLQG